MKRIYCVTGVAALVLAAGCSSARTNMLHRDESNLAWQRERHLHGVPITLAVPTHCKVYVTEKHFLIDKSETTENANGSKTTIKGVERMNLPVVVRDVRHEIIFTDKIFTVDFLRPAAGTFNLDVDFERQYFKKIQHDVVDETIDDVGNLIAKLAPKGVFGAPISTGGEDVAKQVLTLDSVVAVGLFEIDAPDFEQQVMQFVNCHVNKAHTALVAPPGVTGVVRLPAIDSCYDCNGGPGMESAPLSAGAWYGIEYPVNKQTVGENPADLTLSPEPTPGPQ